MMMPSDNDYLATKQIKLGNATLHPDFRKLADYIDQTFGVMPINILYDTIGTEKRPRLTICFEFEKEKQLFHENNGYFNYDSKKQKMIAEQFEDTLKELYGMKERRWLGVLESSPAQQYNPDHVWVCYDAFEQVARIEANQKIPQEKIDELKQELSSEELWEISRAFDGTTFFVYTDEQVKLYEASDTCTRWADRYFDLLEPYNEFGYFRRDTFKVYLDSKENFDNNYASNWFYYYK